MNYYPHHIGDFRSGSIHMTRMERWIYRDMIEVYYDTEKPLPLDVESLCHAIGVRTEDEHKIVANLLRYKFEQTDCGFRNLRCDDEIASYHAKAETAKANGKLGGRPAKPKANPDKPSGFLSGSDPVAICNPEQTGSQANQEPITKNQINTPYPAVAGPVGKSRNTAIALQTYLDQCKVAGVKPVPEDASVFAYASSVGISQDLLRLQWLEFKERYAAPGAKRYKAWTVVFDKSIRGNWFKLWYADSNGGYALTTVGLQAQRRHKEAA